MALRAIMDGTGFDAVILRDPGLIEFYLNTECPGGVLVVIAAEAVLIGGSAQIGDGVSCVPASNDALAAATSGAVHVATDDDSSLGVMIRRQAAQGKGPSP